MKNMKLESQVFIVQPSLLYWDRHIWSVLFMLSIFQNFINFRPKPHAVKTSVRPWEGNSLSPKLKQNQCQPLILTWVEEIPLNLACTNLVSKAPSSISILLKLCLSNLMGRFPRSHEGKQIGHMRRKPKPCDKMAINF